MRSSVLQFEHRPQSPGELASILRQLTDMACHHESEAERLRSGVHDVRGAMFEALCPPFALIEDPVPDPARVAALAEADAMATSLRTEIERTRAAYDAAVCREAGRRTS